MSLYLHSETFGHPQRGPYTILMKAVKPIGAAEMSPAAAADLSPALLRAHPYVAATIVTVKPATTSSSVIMVSRKNTEFENPCATMNWMMQTTATSIDNP